MTTRSATQEQESFLQIRTQIKNQVNRFEKYLSDYNQNPNITQLKLRRLTFEKYLEQFESIQNKIEEFNKNADENNIERESFENKYFDCLTFAENLISKTSLETKNNSLPQFNASIQLPTINLPTFTGSYEHWTYFHDTFNSLIHTNNAITDIQKFHYLRSCLKNEASHVIQSLEVSAINYETAWNLLKQRYQNTRLIVHNHVKALFDLTPINKESHTALRQLLDNVLKHIRALTSLNQPTEHWGTLLIHIISSKLDSTTKRDWESSKFAEELPTFKELTLFLSNKCQLLETLNMDKPHINSKISEIRSFTSTSYKHICVHCGDNHYLYQCDKFKALSVHSRFLEIKNKKLCINCFRSDHIVANCNGKVCKKCGQKHNTLLHMEPRKEINQPSTHNEKNLKPVDKEQLTVASCSNTSHSQVLLSTALVTIRDNSGLPHQCRVLLDSGSQSNFATEELCRKLKLNLQKTHVPIAGISQSTNHVKQITKITINSNYNAFNATLKCLVLPKITEHLPVCSFDPSEVHIPGNIFLADPKFNESGKIDMLLGAEIFWNLLCIGQIKLGLGKPILQKTQLGWITSGKLETIEKERALQCNLNIEKEINSQLERFWLLEECQNPLHLTKEEEQCENHFVNTTVRDQSGRFIVELPFRENLADIGKSKQLAIKRLHAVEKRLQHQPDLKAQYEAFLDTYEALGHMTKVNDKNDSNEVAFYLPHHPVIKKSSSSTKLRVVFDGSAKSSTNVSLNSTLHIGPTVQNTLFSIIIRFRAYSFAFTADIEKMYRQILISPKHRRFQRILWRKDPQKPIETYELNTVTYGLTSSAFQATRCLREIGLENAKTNPRLSNVIINDFYVDDILSGSNSIQSAVTLCSQLKNSLKSSGFNLTKWASSHPEILDSLCFEKDNDNIVIDDNNEVKLLGIQWNTKTDTFQYTVKQPINTNLITKRTILSSIAQIFDPLGLIGPVTVKFKIIMQKLWQLQLAWDESVPQDIYYSWNKMYSEIEQLNSISVPRHVIWQNSDHVQLHGFCDSSEAAYGACIYIRSTNELGKHLVSLIAAKSRVAPLKTQTLPRLELCGALLLSKLMQDVKISLTNVKIENIFYWCDSTITLAWIALEPTKLQTFVGNRVSEIQKLTGGYTWSHVRSADNPADVISRGVNPKKLLGHQLWWHGPPWLSEESEIWPSQHQIEVSSIPDLKNLRVSLHSSQNNFLNDFFHKFSKFVTLQRVSAYCLRFINNLKFPNSRKNGNLSSAELEEATTKLVKLAQLQSFSVDIQNLKKQNRVESKSKLLALSPFLDSDGIIRVGGRLQSAIIPYSQKHPRLLPPKHKLTQLIITHYHIKSLHAGTQAVLNNIRLSYWIISGRNAVKGIVRQCIRCFRVNPTHITPQMGNLPNSRITPSRPFSSCGVDFAGPFLIKDGKTRCRKLVKSYLCIFVCFATKAVHLELVGDLSTEAFLAALRRFIARRGKCTNIYSDNGSNFVGAKNEIDTFQKLINDSSQNRKLNSFFIDENITWHLLPPRSPNFGGLWEAAVKSSKHHMKRVIGNAHFTYEEMYTVLTQIEACLNSRPLTPLSNDPNDLAPLTPAHFLIGDSLMALPEPDLGHLKPNRLNRFQKIQQTVQHFWNRWSKEYLSQLQHRSKWKKHCSTQIKEGTLVLLKNEQLPPLQWKLGRVLQTFPGNDGIVRVVTIKTINGIKKRSVFQMCVLPIDEQ